MTELPPKLIRRLRDRAVEHDVRDDNTVILESVPIAGDQFSQPVTALMVKRPRPGLSYVVCVDESLIYRGDDREVDAVFRGSICRQGWRTLLIALPGPLTLDAAVDAALAIVGFDGPPRIPVLAAPRREPPRMLDRLGMDLTADARSGTLPAILGREDELTDCVSAMLSHSTGLIPLILGTSGVGKSAMLQGIAALLHERFPEFRMVAVNLAEATVGASVDSDLERSLAALLREAAAEERLVLAVEHFELLLIGRMPRVLARMMDGGRLRLIATMPMEFAHRLRAPLLRRLAPVRLEPMRRDVVRAIVRQAATRMAATASVEIPESMVDVCLRAAASLAGTSPARELALLDLATARCRLTGHRALSADDLHFTAQRLLRNAAEEGDA